MKLIALKQEEFKNVCGPKTTKTVPKCPNKFKMADFLLGVGY